VCPDAEEIDVQHLVGYLGLGDHHHHRARDRIVLLRIAPPIVQSVIPITHRT
jgi:hypothetical protein